MAPGRARVVAPSPGHIPHDSVSPTLRAQQHTSAPSVVSAPSRPNLRTTAIALAAILEVTGCISVSALTESVLARSAAEAAQKSRSQSSRKACRTSQPTAEGELALAAERNNRRRIYDAVKVMVAVGLAERTSDKKNLRWKGRTHIFPAARAKEVTRRPSSARPSSAPASPHPLPRPGPHPCSDTDNELSLSTDLEVFRQSVNPPAPCSDSQPGHLRNIALPSRTEVVRDNLISRRDAIEKKRSWCSALEARIQSYSALSKRGASPAGRAEFPGISLPFIVAKGTPMSIRRSRSASLVELSYGKAPTLFSESDIVTYLQKPS